MRNLLLALEERGKIDIDLSPLSAADFTIIVKAARTALLELKKAGPQSDLFSNPYFYPGFLSLFRDLVCKLESDSRNENAEQNIAANLVLSSWDKPQVTEPLGLNEFRCFSCEGIIHREDRECKIFGWTWK